MMHGIGGAKVGGSVGECWGVWNTSPEGRGPGHIPPLGWADGTHAGGSLAM